MSISEVALRNSKSLDCREERLDRERNLVTPSMSRPIFVLHNFQNLSDSWVTAARGLWSALRHGTGEALFDEAPAGS